MRKLTITLALAILAPSAAGAADKEKDRADQIAASQALARGEILPIARILGIANARVPGDVLKVKLKRKPAGFQYDVKILAKNGVVREVEVEAKTGQILSIEDD
jgi:uncharacterized membrane protein YkoI